MASSTLLIGEPDSNSTTGMDSMVFQAAANGEIQVLKNIVVNNQLCLDQLLTAEKNTVVHVNIIASKSSTMSFLEGILEMCPQLLLQTNSRGETPLHLAARYGHELIVEFLIIRAKLLERSDLEKATLGVDGHGMMRQRNKEMDTALHEAVRFNHLKVVRILTKQDPHFTHLANEAGETPLYMAVEAEYLDLVDEILNNCSSPLTTGPYGRNVLHAAILTENTGLTRKILENILDLTKHADKDSLIPLHYAVMPTPSNNLEIVKMLLEKDESSAYFKDKNGTTALHMAASNPFRGYEIVKEILSRCPDSYEVVDDEGKNLLHYAVRKQSPSTLKLILDHSSLLNNYLLNRKDNEGNTPLLHVFATSTKYTEKNFEALMSHPKVNKMLFNQQNKNIHDIAHDLYNVHYHEFNKRELSKIFKENPTIKSCLRKSFSKDDKQILTDTEKRKLEQKEKLRTRIANYRESTLVAAALIATVTFTAGLTLPGGYISDDNKVGHGQQQGSAVLRNNAAFQAFMVTDAIALVLSITAVFINLLLTIASSGDERANKEFVSNYNMSMNLTILALGFMMIAFVTGTYAVLSLSKALAIFICVIGLSFFVLLFFITKSKFKRFDFTNIRKLKPIIMLG
uniref:PGG domain-containing protein n=1 Tax=Cannabis sativa TaxID=3483 RepID=A0A803QND3_CANSA